MCPTLKVHCGSHGAVRLGFCRALMINMIGEVNFISTGLVMGEKTSLIFSIGAQLSLPVVIRRLASNRVTQHHEV